MAGWYSTGMVDCHKVKVGEVENGEITYDGETIVVCDYCRKELSYGERCDCEESKW